jgi:hypothetical protein
MLPEMRLLCVRIASACGFAFPSCRRADRFSLAYFPFMNDTSALISGRR